MPPAERARGLLLAGALAIGPVACADDLVIGERALDAATIAPGTYELRVGAASSSVCSGLLAAERTALEDAGAAALGLVDGAIEVAMPAGFVVVGGPAIEGSFGVATLTLAQGAPAVPGAWFAATLPVSGAGPLGTTRVRATLALVDLDTGEALASSEVVRPGGAGRCTLTYPVALVPR